VDLQAAGEQRLGRLDRAARVEDPAPAERVDDERGGHVAAVGVDRVARPAVDLGDLEAGAAVREQVGAQLPVVEGRERPRQRPHRRAARGVDDEPVERLTDRRLQAQVLEPLGRRGARARLALADLVAVEHQHPRARAREGPRRREAREARPADEHVGVGLGQAGALRTPLGRSDRHVVLEGTCRYPSPTHGN
jgi:hypothetical protein